MLSNSSLLAFVLLKEIETHAKIKAALKIFETIYIVLFHHKKSNLKSLLKR